jgi:hypothetical protein
MTPAIPWLASFNTLGKCEGLLLMSTLSEKYFSPDILIFDQPPAKLKQRWIWPRARVALLIGFQQAFLKTVDTFLSRP